MVDYTAFQQIYNVHKSVPEREASRDDVSPIRSSSQPDSEIEGNEQSDAPSLSKEALEDAGDNERDEEFPAVKEAENSSLGINNAISSIGSEGTTRVGESRESGGSEFTSEAERSS